MEICPYEKKLQLSKGKKKVLSPLIATYHSPRLVVTLALGINTMVSE